MEEMAKVQPRLWPPFSGPGPCKPIQFLDEVSNAKECVFGAPEVTGIFDNIKD